VQLGRVQRATRPIVDQLALAVLETRLARQGNGKEVVLVHQAALRAHRLVDLHRRHFPGQLLHLLLFGGEE
jgi:hypothetical protein